jgi:16S rRNA (cytosine1402-N4)-methyltransferase
MKIPRDHRAGSHESEIKKVSGQVTLHKPVMLAEALRGLSVRRDGIYVDATFGRGGHTQGIVDALGPDGRLLVLDRDPQAIEAAFAMLHSDQRVSIRQGSFATLEDWLREQRLIGRVNGVLFDLGVSSPQLDDPERGFSFLKEGPLDMRMDPSSGISAAVWLGKASTEEIASVLWDFGEERHARSIARALVKARLSQPLKTTGQLAAIVTQAQPSREKHKHPATRTFQAIRIFINQELSQLDMGLEQATRGLAPGGRLVVFSFHSLEDQRVKRFFRRQARGDDLPPNVPISAAQLHPRLRLVGKPQFPSQVEVAANPRARSAVLRIAERIQ